MADESGKGTANGNGSSNSEDSEKPKNKIEPIRLPTVEEIRGQDIWNNCAMRSVFSGVMGIQPSLFSLLFFSNTFYLLIKFIY